MRRELAIEFSRVTEAAALAGYKWLGRGDKNVADGAAVEAMRLVLNQVEIDGEIVMIDPETGDRLNFDQLQQRFYRQVNFDTFYH
mgnify:CR=1 FL=1